ncbi:MAG: hypothetical protein K1X75_07290 [Leptospirales bacterium]|nr:hypothetical protein [Leptospirales bacterium]
MVDATPGSPVIGPELVREYNRILGDLVNLLTDEQLPMLLAMVERANDDCADLRRDLNAERLPALFRIKRWREALRLLRLSMALKSELAAEYDRFVIAYQQLSGKQKPDEDERKLIEEISALMYRIDELSGEQDRFALRYIGELSKALKAVHGIMLELDPGAMEETIPPAQLAQLQPEQEQLMKLTQELLQQVRIMTVLIRLRKLIAKM